MQANKALREEEVVSADNNIRREFQNKSSTWTTLEKSSVITVNEKSGKHFYLFQEIRIYFKYFKLQLHLAEHCVAH